MNSGGVAADAAAAVRHSCSCRGHSLLSEATTKHAFLAPLQSIQTQTKGNPVLVYHEVSGGVRDAFKVFPV